ncbi:MAG: arginine N-succinyltransferase [Deltaproteobacteria bacterium]|nr:arginine N-succinyltransferase [Candidatus Tharpellaceae bacterium]
MTQQESRKGFSGLQVFGIAVLVMIVAVAGTIFAARAWFFPRPFKPVVLSQQEEKRLERKLEQFERPGYKPLPATKASKSKPQKNDWLSDGRLKPEVYSEKGVSREINLSERELNGLLAKNTDLARKMAIDLSGDLVSARLLLPVDPDFPLFGGKTLRVRAGLELAYRDQRPIVKIRGVSIMGVPVPAAWLGGLKNVDLVKEFGSDQGFWKSFSDGVESITIREGELHIKLKE